MIELLTRSGDVLQLQQREPGGRIRLTISKTDEDGEAVTAYSMEPEELERLIDFWIDQKNN